MQLRSFDIELFRNESELTKKIKSKKAKTKTNSGEKKFRTAHDLMVTSKLCQKIDMFL